MPEIVLVPPRIHFINLFYFIFEPVCIDVLWTCLGTNQISLMDLYWLFMFLHSCRLEMVLLWELCYTSELLSTKHRKMLCLKDIEQFIFKTPEISTAWGYFTPVFNLLHCLEFILTYVCSYTSPPYPNAFQLPAKEECYHLRFALFLTLSQEKSALFWGRELLIFVRRCWKRTAPCPQTREW